MNLQRAPQSPLPAGDRTKQPGSVSREALLIKLPLLATVARLVVDRGFGFVRYEATKDEQFLHVTAAVDGRRDFLGMEEGDLLLCTVDDNGIGREQAASINTSRLRKHHSVGIDITRRRLRLLHHEKNTEYRYLVKDKHEENGLPAGTTVIFSIPFNR